MTMIRDGSALPSPTVPATAANNRKAPRRYFLTDFDRWHFENRARWSALSEEKRDGWHRLYNKNMSETCHVRIVGQVPNRMVWIVECEEVPPYFRNVLKPVTHPEEEGP